MKDSDLKLNIFNEEKPDETIPPHPLIKLLIIDEVSMCDAKLLRRVEKRMRQLMRNDLPVGGCTTVFFGDILQIPPVPEKGPDGIPTKVDYVFESPLWKNLVQYEELETVMRQERDPEYVERLKRWRVGQCTKEDDEFLNRKAHSWINMDLDTETANIRQQFKLPGYKMVLPFKNSTIFNFNKNMTEKLFHPEHIYQISNSTYAIHQDIASSSYVPRFTFSKYSRVLVNKNSRSTRLVNGEMFTVRNTNSIENRVISLDVTLDSTQEFQEFEPVKSDLVLGSDTMSWKIEFQIQPAYALTYHKSQKQILNAVFLAVEKSLQAAMFYVGASRVRCSDDLFSSSYYSSSSNYADPVALAEYVKNGDFIVPFPDHSGARIKFQLGDRVRISAKKGHFDKGYEQGWTTEAYVISRVVPGKPFVYNSVDTNGDEIEGIFYTRELTKCTYDPNAVYRIEEVLDTRVWKGKKQSLVKWEGS
ncbi:unnamed protein product [Caenorhabditis nigoni]